MEARTYPSAPGDTLVFENGRVRVWSMTLAPGGACEFHQHHHDHFILWPDAGRARGQELGDPSWSLTQVAEPGYVMFRTVGSGGPLTPHRIRNLEDYAVTHYIVELIGEPSPSEHSLPSVFNGRGYVADDRDGEGRP